jgi:hypothetical protein
MACSAILPTIHHDTCKLSCNAIALFFSTQAGVHLAKIQWDTGRLTDCMKVSIERGEPIPILFAPCRLTVDIICEYLFGRHLQLMDREDWGRSFYLAWHGL